RHTRFDCDWSSDVCSSDLWEIFQKMFEESGFEVYEHRESVIEFMQTEQQKKAENRRLAVIELAERVRDRYWSVEEKGDVEKTERSEERRVGKECRCRLS